MDLIDTGHRQISRRLDLVRLKVLGTVVDRGSVRPGELAGELAMTASAVSRHLAALEDAGQVELTVDPADARTFLVTPTAAGRAARHGALTAGTAAFTGVIAQWTDEQVEAALASVQLLNDTWAGHHADQAAPAGSRRTSRNATRRRTE